MSIELWRVLAQGAGMIKGIKTIPQGYFHAIGACIVWGLLPIYFKAVPEVGPVEMVMHRILWSSLVLMLLTLVRGELVSILAHLSNRRVMVPLTMTALLIVSNWLVYIWAVAHDHILAASLGYFLNPLINVALGVVVLKERLRPMQMAAVAVAMLGVAMMALTALDTLWISLFLAVSFALYGLVRKMAPVEALPGLTIETLILMPIAVVYFFWMGLHGGFLFDHDLITNLLLPLSGVLTSIPLFLFARAARSLPLATLGVLQYLSPSIQFAVGFWLFGEPLGMGKLLSFTLIWAGLIIFTRDALADLHRKERAREARGG